jgi:hypothetical protein
MFGRFAFCLLFFLLLFLTTTQSHGQDLIVLNTNDSIPCELVYKGKDYIAYRVKKEYRYLRFRIPLEDVKEIKPGFYKKQTEKKDSSHSIWREKVRLELNGGSYSYRLKIGDDWSNPASGHIVELKSGKSLGAELLYKRHIKQLYGFKVNFSKSFNARERAYDNGVVFLKKELYSVYFGPVLMHKFTRFSDRHYAYLKASPGLYRFFHQSNSSKYSGFTSVGLLFSLGFDFTIFCNVKANVCASLGNIFAPIKVLSDEINHDYFLFPQKRSLRIHEVSIGIRIFD